MIGLTLTLAANMLPSDGPEVGLKMAQRNPIEHSNVSAAEAARKELERLAAEQGVRPIADLDSLKANFWPKDENVDDFVRTVRKRRRDSESRESNSTGRRH